MQMDELTANRDENQLVCQATAQLCMLSILGCVAGECLLTYTLL